MTCMSWYGGFPKMVGLPNWPMGFPTKNDQHLGCDMVGVPSNLRKQPYGKYSPSFKQTVFFNISNGVPEISSESTRRESTNPWGDTFYYQLMGFADEIAHQKSGQKPGGAVHGGMAGWRSRGVFSPGSEFQAVSLSNGKNKLGGVFKKKNIFTPIWGTFPFWLIFFKWVETTN